MHASWDSNFQASPTCKCLTNQATQSNSTSVPSAVLWVLGEQGVGLQGPWVGGRGQWEKRVAVPCVDEVETEVAMEVSVKQDFSEELKDNNSKAYIDFSNSFKNQVREWRIS